MPPPFTVSIDWTDANPYFVDNVFPTGYPADDDLSPRVRSVSGIQTDRGRDQLRDLSPPMAGDSSVVLDNTDRHLSAENASSPIFAYLGPGHAIRYKSDYLSSPFTPAVGAGLAYDTIDGISSYVIAAGDILQYDVYWSTVADFAAIDLDDAAGSRLRGSGAVDQNGLSANASTDISAYALLGWYTRAIVLPASLVGKTITRFMIGVEHTWADTTLRTPRFRNVRITSSDYSTVNKAILIYSDALTIAHTNRYVANGVAFSAGSWLAHYQMWQGITDNLKQQSAPEQLSVEITALGLLSKLKGKTVSTNALYQNIDTGTAIGYLLSQLGFAYSSIETGLTVMDWWWLYNEDAFSAITTLLYTEGPGAELFEDGQGRVTFYSRHHKLLNALSTTSQATYRDTGSEPLFSRPWNYDPGIKDVVNRATATCTTRAFGALGVIWNYGSTITLAPGESRQLLVVASGPFDYGQCVNGVDYATSSGTLTSVSFDQTGVNGASGQQRILTIVAGVLGAVVDSAALDGTGIRVQAKLAVVTSTNTIQNTIDASASIDRYGLRTFDLPLRQDIPFATAQDLVNGTVGVLQYSRPQVVVTLNGGSWTREVEGFTREIADRVTVVEAQSGMNADVWIERIQHNVRFGGAQHDVVFGCDKVWTNNYFILDVSMLDVGVLGF